MTLSWHHQQFTTFINPESLINQVKFRVCAIHSCGENKKTKCEILFEHKTVFFCEKMKTIMFHYAITNNLFFYLHLVSVTCRSVISHANFDVCTLRSFGGVITHVCTYERMNKQKSVLYFRI